MNVTILSGLTRNAGGIFYAVSALATHLHKQGLNIRVMGPRDGFVIEDQNAWGPLKTVPYTAYGPLRWSSELHRKVDETTCDLLHLNGLWLGDQMEARRWQKKSDQPVIISPHGMLDPWAVRNSAWKKKLVGALFANESLRSATCIHALCRSEADSIRAYGLKNPIAIIPNGVELPDLESPPGRADKKKLLFLGRIHPKKGLKELIEAWAMFQRQQNKRGSEWKLVIAGWDDGGYESGLKQLAGQMGIDDAVEFVGPQFGADKDLLLRSVDAFILPSFSEGLPMSVLEAWSYGLPVIMTDQCNLPEGFEAGAALRVEPAVGAISDGLMQLADMEQGDLAAMGTKGRKLVERSYTWDQIATEMKAVYEWCLGGDKPACILDA